MTLRMLFVVAQAIGMLYLPADRSRISIGHYLLCKSL